MASRDFKPQLSSLNMEEILGLNMRALDRARISRDARFDGKFFIAITSTRIYCRPICPSPRAKRINVRYFPTAAAASAAGYRPCLRCRPEAAPGTPAWLGTSAVVRRALRLIDDGFLDHDSVEQLAARLGIGSRHLHRLFLQHVGAPPIIMAQVRRLHFAKRLLDDTELPITDIAFAAGFQSIRRFNSAFQQTFRRPPREFRKRVAERTSKHGDEVLLRLAYRPPYDWQQVRDFFAARAIAGVERVDEDGYTRTVRTPNGHALVRVRPLANEPALELTVTSTEPGALLHISSTARRVFDVASDPVLIAAAFKTDPAIGPLVARRPGLRIPGTWDIFECAVRAIVGQQISVAGARTLLGRIVRRAGATIDADVTGFSHLFPRPEDVVNADLTGLGLTTSRANTLQLLARAIVDRAIDVQSTAENIFAGLTSIPGIGDWTAQYVALRALGEPDAFPSSDLVLRRVAADGKAILSPQQLLTMAERWRPWRAYAASHLWRAASDAEQ
jgi:AraC family transcriptional regulator of adaptative response / DNA-3-methyladenine glycosylase II